MNQINKAEEKVAQQDAMMVEQEIQQTPQQPTQAQVPQSQQGQAIPDEMINQIIQLIISDPQLLQGIIQAAQQQNQIPA